MGEDNYGTHCRTIFLLAGLSFNCIHKYITPWAEIKSRQMKSCQISHPCLAQLFWIITTESFEGLLFQLSVIFLQSHFFLPFFQLYFTIFLPTINVLPLLYTSVSCRIESSNYQLGIKRSVKGLNKSYIQIESTTQCIMLDLILFAIIF